MSWGLQNRLARILKPPHGRTVMLAVDHGYFLGPTSGLEEPRQDDRTAAAVRRFVDADARRAADVGARRRRTSRSCLRVSGGTSILRELSHEGLTVAIEDAIRLNVSAVTLSIFVGSEGERQTLLNLAKLVDQGEKYGIPVLAVTAVGKEMTRDARYLGLCCRIAAEIGAHFVKTYYCEGFDEIVRATPVPLIIAGGKKTGEREAIELAAQRDARGGGGCRHGAQHLPVGLSGRDDPGRPRGRARRLRRSATRSRSTSRRSPRGTR